MLKYKIKHCQCEYDNVLTMAVKTLLSCRVWPSCAYLSICVINICVKHTVMSAALHSRIYLLLYMWDSRMWKALPLLPFHPLGWVTNKLNRIPKCNLSNRSHTSQDTCLISGKQLSCSHEFVRARSRTDLTKDLGTDLECAHVLFPVQADSLKQAGRAVRRGDGAQDNGTHDVHGKCTAGPFIFSLHIVLSIFSLPFSNFTSLSLTCFKGEKLQYPEVICVTCFIIYSFTMIMIKHKGSLWWGSICWSSPFFILFIFYQFSLFSCLNPKWITLKNNVFKDKNTYWTLVIVWSKHNKTVS